MKREKNPTPARSPNVFRLEDIRAAAVFALEAMEQRVILLGITKLALALDDPLDAARRSVVARIVHAARNFQSANQPAPVPAKKANP